MKQENNPTLNEIVQPDNNLKNILVEHVGKKLKPENGHVTVEMIIEVLADEFPETVLVLAEENWIRGYQQGSEDVETGRKMMEKENEKRKSCKLCED